MPLTWQGWLVYMGWIGMFFGGLAALGMRRPQLPHVIFVLVMVALLFAVCLWKGEPPRWRWGE